MIGRVDESLDFVPELDLERLQPEPLEQQRYLLALLAVVAVVPLAVVVARRVRFRRALRFAPPVGLIAVFAVASISEPLSAASSRSHAVPPVASDTPAECAVAPAPTTERSISNTRQLG